MRKTLPQKTPNIFSQKFFHSGKFSDLESVPAIRGFECRCSLDPPGQLFFDYMIRFPPLKQIFHRKYHGIYEHEAAAHQKSIVSQSLSHLVAHIGTHVNI